jgi:hypothetical protein
MERKGSQHLAGSLKELEYGATEPLHGGGCEALLSALGHLPCNTVSTDTSQLIKSDMQEKKYVDGVQTSLFKSMILFLKIPIQLF